MNSHVKTIDNGTIWHVDVEELEVKDEDDVRTDGGEDCEEADRC
jgi:hypothetical protein